MGHSISKPKYNVDSLYGFDILSEDRQQRLGFVLATGVADQSWAAFNCLHDYWMVGHYPTANAAIKAVLEYERQIYERADN